MRNWQIGILGALSTAMAAGCSADTVSERVGSQDRGAPDESLGVARQSLVTECEFSDPSNFPIKFDTEMIIRARSVVDDPCRTLWTSAGCGARLGQWTFGQLLANMSGSGVVTSVTAQRFVGTFMKSWLNTQTVGSDPNPVQARGNFRSNFLGPWLTASNCSLNADPTVCFLDLKKAPFRLLAITNRIDMAGFDYATGLSGPGELRFAFGALDGSATKLNAVFILEYKYPTTRSAQAWGTLFHGLSNPALALPASPLAAPNTTPFADQLQSITDLVVGMNAQPGAHNGGNSIGQIRTNENAFDDKNGFSKEWEFRQFTLPCANGATCNLTQVPVSQTPPTAANNTAPMGSFLNANKALLSTSQHIVPSTLLGGSSLSLSGNSAVLWEVPNPVALNPNSPTAPEALVRHNFAFATCNGCHYLETANQNQQFHIGPRAAGARATLSNFIGFSGSLDPKDGDAMKPENAIDVADPDLNSAEIFAYNEPWRRACEMKRILRGDTIARTSATGHAIF